MKNVKFLLLVYLNFELTLQPRLDVVNTKFPIGIQVAVCHHLRQIPFSRRYLRRNGRRHLCQATYLEAPGNLQQAAQVLLGHGNLATVHEDKQQLHVLEVDILEDHNRVFAGIPEKEILEVRAAHREDEFMGGEVVVATRDRHIDKLFLMAQVFGKLEKTLMMVLPPQHEIVRVIGLGRGWCGRRRQVVGWPGHFFRHQEHNYTHTTYTV